MSFDTLNAWPKWAHITEEEAEQLGSALHKAQVLEFRASWFAKAIFGVEPLSQWESPQHKLQELGCPVSTIGLNDEQAHDKALAQWWVLQGTPNDKELLQCGGIHRGTGRNDAGLRRLAGQAGGGQKRGATVAPHFL